LFEKLSEIELKHQDRIFDMYLQVTGKKTAREAFDKEIVIQAVEGGLTTDEYINMFQPDWNSAVDIISLAMSIEAQALDLYTRAADRSTEPHSVDALKQIAAEERMHLEQLGKLMDAQA
jgi:rubrerythrin